MELNTNLNASRDSEEKTLRNQHQMSCEMEIDDGDYIHSIGQMSENKFNKSGNSKHIQFKPLNKKVKNQKKYLKLKNYIENKNKEKLANQKKIIIGYQNPAKVLSFSDMIDEGDQNRS